ncbi:MAG: AmmeMemoRadiSam system protein B [Candidatus Buchananbacteria bacterium RIFCSPLOWO2_02_FULL_46_11b]|uniref:AmmeMemoRadiSam system protein B n=1 Tax=Candidatus Buchananbacteria bacterium RIFCSPLOWO2_02_FULL_46_11b TaxID=1797548 RepID=A0A1G1YXU2_9BACT|nr:MAG: AmmeMemoRadiSam system protein B [Candidatus Buchananbacteria bacterium RIFCSPLOWO2_02_FULL_46_11b]
MPIVFAAITPHPPVLIPEIGKDNLKKIEKTQAAMKKLEQEFYAAKPESVLIISPHGKILPEGFNINLSADYSANFKEFGDFGVELKFKSDYLTIQNIRAADETSQAMPVVLSSESQIDHGFAVPLYYLLAHAKNLPIIPITYSALDFKDHFAFGQFLRRRLAHVNKRFAIIASGDLSHRLTKDAPGGFSEEGKKFDKHLIDLLKKGDWQEIVKIKPKFSQDAAECGLRSILILLGIAESFKAKAEVLSYEGPFGVGYLVCNFKLA